MNMAVAATEGLFDGADVIHSYTRAQALDGVLCGQAVGYSESFYGGVFAVSSTAWRSRHEATVDQAEVGNRSW